MTPYSGPISINLSPPVPLTVAGQMLTLDPGHPDGVTLSAGVDYAVIPCPTSWSFDALTTLGAGLFPQGLVDGGGSQPWTSDTGGTSSSATGPTTASTMPNHVYCETSGAGGTAQFILDTCVIDATQLSSFTLDFALSRIGATIGTLNVYQDDGAGTFTNLIATYTGAEPSSSRASWLRPSPCHYWHGSRQSNRRGPASASGLRR